jgi:multiple sugar transport system permease protein
VTTAPRGRTGRRHWLDWMVVPTLVILAVVVGYPIVRAVLLSFQRYKVLTGLPAESAGLGNYRDLLHDPVFWESLRNTVVYTGVSVGIAAVVGLVLALLTENLNGPWRFVRTVLLTPWAVPLVVVAFLFRYIFDQDAGVANGILRGLGLIDSNVHWLTSSTWAMPAVIVTNAWTAAPFFYLIFTAALTSVPTEVIESARVDRASLWSMVVRIKLPYLRGPALVAVLIMVVNSFNDFTKIWSMTEGGPGYSTTTLVIYVYRLAFSSFNMGYAAAVGVVWLVLLILFAAGYIRLLQRRAS